MTARRRSSPPRRGGKGGSEPRVRIRGRERRAVELAIQGWTQHEIAADLQVTQAAISKILARADARALRELTSTVERQKVRQSQRLERVFAEGMRAWEVSKADATRRRQRKTDGRGASEQTVAEVTVESQHGDARYLEAARKALGDLRKIWGLDAAQHVDLTTTDPYAALTETQLLERFAEQDALLRRVLAATAPAGTEKTS